MQPSYINPALLRIIHTYVSDINTMPIITVRMLGSPVDCTIIRITAHCAEENDEFHGIS